MIMCDMIVFLEFLGWFFPMIPTLVGSELCFDLVLWSLGRCMFCWGTCWRGRVACSLPCMVDFMARWVFLAHRRFLVGDLVSLWHLFSSGWPILGLTWWFEIIGVIWFDLLWVVESFLLLEFCFGSCCVWFLFLDCKLPGVSLVFGGDDVVPLPFDFYKSS